MTNSPEAERSSRVQRHITPEMRKKTKKAKAREWREFVLKIVISGGLLLLGAAIFLGIILVGVGMIGFAYNDIKDNGFNFWAIFWLLLGLSIVGGTLGSSSRKR